MATVPPITVPVVADLINAGLKCSPCTDRAITDDNHLATVPDADTMSPVPLVTNVLGQQIAAVVVIPVCYDCRKQQLGPVSKTGLVTA